MSVLLNMVAADWDDEMVSNLKALLSREVVQHRRANVSSLPEAVHSVGTTDVASSPSSQSLSEKMESSATAGPLLRLSGKTELGQGHSPDSRRRSVYKVKT